jgi:O-antigen/teichoic acid export membrane protein
LTKILTVFAGGNLVGLILRLVGGVLLARVTRPETLGLFNGLSLVLGYVPFAQLGVINGLNRELPYFIGLDDSNKARGLAACAQAWALMIGSVVGVALLGIAIFQLAKGRTTLAFGWATQAWMAFQVIFTQLYLLVIYRTGAKFTRLTTSNVIQAIASFLLVSLVWKFGFYGLCMRGILVSLVALGTLWLWRPLRVKSLWDTSAFNHLLKVGAPILAVGQVYAAWTVLDSTLVLKLTGTHGLGLYAVATIAAAAIELVPTSLNQICYPRMAEEYGRTGSVRAIIRIIWKPTVYLSMAYVPLIIVGWILTPPAVRLLLPRYADSIRAVQWTLLSTSLLALSPLNLVFVVLKRMTLYLVGIVSGVASYLAALFVAHRAAHDLSIFPKAFLIGRIIFFIVCFTMIWRWRNDKKPHSYGVHET